MLHSTKFKQTVFNWEGQQFKIEYDLSTLSDKSSAGFGNIYIKEGEDPLSFTFFTINNQIAGYTPMNGTKDFISAIVETVMGVKLTFSDLASL